MSLTETSVITRYFEASARRDIDAVVASFSEEALVVDENHTYHGSQEIREWQEGVASIYEYTTQILDTKRLDEKSYLVIGRLTGNFPGGIADLQYRFVIHNDLIERLEIV
ncbi:nuclear transport factor 2 family protein [Ktedonospora formicarum]|uniref:SnoaL-like domain-containing protein n=1 Tax=Ktedonospora formicarum TaxID=2778364 RepID=A0A8J3MUR9_9CHLR|nr:nuclear transport factor 2 family protein [Ktedonospora formicarum]GHO46888.1 hypothetical protein KSX_50510 [Ktedonospora formicarum]